MATNIPYDTMSTTSKSDSMFSKCCFCVPLRLGCFILGYAALVYNCFRILSILGVTVFVGIISHGFDHIDRDASGLDDKALNHEILKYSLIALIVILVISLVWLAVNIAVLVGVHKKRPGPIKVYVGFACFRLALIIIAFTYLVVNGRITISTFITQTVDISLTAYFTLVYYIYAIQLEHERTQRLPGPGPDAESVNDLAFIYPKTLSEKHLIA